MKRMIWILALAILPGLLSAQTTVATVTITVPTAAVPIVNAWIATQCAVYATDGITCVTPQYASAKDLAQQSILQWAVTTTDPSIPAAVKTQITNRLNAQAAIANAQTAAATATVTAN